MSTAPVLETPLAKAMILRQELIMKFPNHAVEIRELFRPLIDLLKKEVAHA